MFSPTGSYEKDGEIIPILLPQDMGIKQYDVLFGELFLRPHPRRRGWHRRFSSRTE